MMLFDEFEKIHRKWVQDRMEKGNSPDLAESARFCYDVLEMGVDPFEFDNVESLEEVMAKEIWDDLMEEFSIFADRNQPKYNVFDEEKDLSLETINNLCMFDFFLLGKIIQMNEKLNILIEKNQS